MEITAYELNKVWREGCIACNEQYWTKDGLEWKGKCCGSCPGAFNERAYSKKLSHGGRRDGTRSGIHISCHGSCIS